MSQLVRYLSFKKATGVCSLYRVLFSVSPPPFFSFCVPASHQSVVLFCLSFLGPQEIVRTVLTMLRSSHAVCKMAAMRVLRSMLQADSDLLNNVCRPFSPSFSPLLSCGLREASSFLFFFFFFFFSHCFSWCQEHIKGAIHLALSQSSKQARVHSEALQIIGEVVIFPLPLLS